MLNCRRRCPESQFHNKCRQLQTNTDRLCLVNIAMGVLYSVFPFETDNILRDWLRTQGFSLPDDMVSRNPTIVEIRSVLDALASFKTDYSVERDSWHAFIY